MNPNLNHNYRGTSQNLSHFAMLQILVVNMYKNVHVCDTCDVISQKLILDVFCDVTMTIRWCPTITDFFFYLKGKDGCNHLYDIIIYILIHFIMKQ